MHQNIYKHSHKKWSILNSFLLFQAYSNKYLHTYMQSTKKVNRQKIHDHWIIMLLCKSKATVASSIDFTYLHLCYLQQIASSLHAQIQIVQCSVFQGLDIPTVFNSFLYLYSLQEIVYLNFPSSYQKIANIRLYMHVLSSEYSYLQKIAQCIMLSKNMQHNKQCCLNRYMLSS